MTVANDVVIHVKAEDHASRQMAGIGKKVEVEAKRSFLKSGGHAGAAFAAGFIKTITFGQVGAGFAQAATQMAPQMAHFGGVLGAGLAAGLVFKAVGALQATLPLALGAVLVAGPAMFLIKGMLNAEAKAKQVAARVDSLRKRYAAASSADTKKQIGEELKLAEQQEKMFRDRAHNWLVLKNQAHDFMATISKPLEKPLANIFKDIGKTLKDLAPDLTKTMKTLGKPLEGLAHGALGGISNFIKEVTKHKGSIAAAFEAWGKAFPDLGKRFGKALGDLIANPKKTAKKIKELAGDLSELAGSASAAVTAISDLSSAYGTLAKKIDKQEKTNLGGGSFLLPSKATIDKQIHAVVHAYYWMNVQILSVFDSIATAGAKLGLVPKKFAKGVHDMRVKAEEDLARVDRKFNESQAAINKKKIEAKIKANIKDLEGKVKSAKKRLQETNDKKVRAKIRAEIRDLEAKVRRAKAELKGIHGVNIPISAYVTRGFDHAVAVARTRAGRGLLRASGGNVGAVAASGGNRGGSQVLVGEQGPEIVDLPFGSHVNSNPDSQRIMGQRGNGGHVTININAPNVTDREGLRRMLVDMQRRGQLDVIRR